MLLLGPAGICSLSLCHDKAGLLACISQRSLSVHPTKAAAPVRILLMFAYQIRALPCCPGLEGPGSAAEGGLSRRQAAAAGGARSGPGCCSGHGQLQGFEVPGGGQLPAPCSAWRRWQRLERIRELGTR